MASRTKQRAGIQSVEVAGGILRALADAGQPLALKDLAKLARMPPGKVHRYLVSLVRSELVMQDESSGHYGVGPMAIALGLAGLRNVDVVRIATALLPSLRDEIKETVLLAIWSPRGPVVFALEESRRSVYMNIRVGSILPLLQSATGRVFAAFLPSDMTASILREEMRDAHQLAAQVRNLLDQTREHRLAHVEGVLVPGVNAIAAPLFDHKGRIAGVVGALGRTEEMDVAYDGPVARALLQAATEISRRLGCMTGPE
jgi:DNA-binding IclR family transcriptional regulator